MSLFGLSDLRQKAVLWEATGIDNYGMPTVADPVEISCRWETGRREVVNAEGKTIALDASVAVARAIAVGSILWLGALADWFSTGSAFDDDELHRVETVSRAPDLTGEFIRRELGLIKHRDSLPSST